MSRRRILFAAGPDWESPVQAGDHHLARRFAKAGWRVAYLGSPLTAAALRHLHRADFRRRFRPLAAGGTVDLASGVWHYVPFALLAPYRRTLAASPWLLASWHRLVLPPLLRMLEKAGFGEVDVLHLRDARYAFLSRLVPHRCLVHRLADRDEAFANAAPALVDLQNRLIGEADWVVCPSPLLVEDAWRRGARRVLFLPNGVDEALLRPDRGAPPPEYRAWDGPVAVYVGSFGEWWNAAWVAAASAALPRVHFALIGPEGPGLAGLPRRDNLHVLGPRPREHLAPYLHHCRVGLIPFHRGPLVEAVNPLKLYEYLACGLPVVASESEALRRLGAPDVDLCRTADEFTEAVRYRSRRVRRSAAGRAFARHFGWDRNFRILERAVLRRWKGAPAVEETTPGG